MNFHAYYKSLTTEGREALAKQLDTSVAYLSQLAHKHRQPGHGMAQAIEQITGGQVSRYELRPDIYGDIPEDAA